MHLRAPASLRSLALLAAAFVAACKEQSPIPHTPTHIVIVSGSNQSANVAATLDSSLVVQALDGANRSVSGVQLSWTVTGGGTVAQPNTTTDNDGKSTNKWTLSPTAGIQVVTVTSTQIGGASVSFIANNGATITGNVASSGVSPFGATFSRASARGARIGVDHPATRTFTSKRLVVGFRGDALGVPAAASGAYRSISVASSTKTLMRKRMSALIVAHPAIRNAELSPAILAARFEVTDTTQIDAIIQSLQADPSVAYVTREKRLTIRDGAPRPVAADFAAFTDKLTPVNAAASKLPNDPFYFEQSWPLNMLDLPRAWNVTTGSSAVTVAVVDMGVRFDHPEMAPVYTKDGYDFVSNDPVVDVPEVICDNRGNPTGSFTSLDGDGNGPDPDPTDPDDIEFNFFFNCWQHSTLGDHGLWTSGIIGSPGNEGVGMAGVSWAVKIRPIRVLGIDGGGFFFDIAQGVLYAAGLPAVGANGALVQAPRSPIINMSLGGDSDPTMDQAIAAAVSAGSLIVASAGNDGLDIATFPAASPGVMGVAAVGMDGQLATYSNAGYYLSVSAPGGDFRLDDFGGGGVLGPGWDFSLNRPTYLFGYGTSASAPFVSGIAALLLAQNPSLTAAQLRSRIETYAMRTNGLSRSDNFGWGIVNAYNTLTQTSGPTRIAVARLVDAVSGVVGRTAPVDANGNFVFTKVATGTYYVQAGEDDSGDGIIGLAGRRFAVAGGVGKPTVVNVNNNSSSVAMTLGTPLEVEPNDDIAHANVLTVGSWVAGTITPPDVRDVYSVAIPVAGTYTFETSGLVGACGMGLEVDTILQLVSAAGATIGTSNDAGLATGPFCSRVRATLQPGIYYVTVTGNSNNPLTPNHGRYRLEVRAGT